MATGKQYNIKIKSRLQELPALREFIRKSLEENQCASEDVHAIALAADEACSNIIHHAYKDDHGQDITIGMEVLPRKINLIFMDTGVEAPQGIYQKKFGMTPPSHEPRSRTRGGWGIYLMSRLAKKLRYTRQDGKNILFLSRRRVRTELPGKRFRLRYASLNMQLSLFASLIVLLTVVGISYFILRLENDSMKKQALSRGIWLVKNFAEESVYPILTEENTALLSLVQRARANPDVVYVFIVDEKNIVRVDNENKLMGMPYEIREPILSTFNSEGVTGRLLVRGQEQILDLEQVITAFSSKKKVILGRLHIGIDQKAIQSHIKEATQQILAVSFFALLVAVILTGILSTFIVRPIRRLALGAQKIGRGEFDHRIELKSQNEIGDLASAFNTMAVDLKAAQGTQREKLKMEHELGLAAQIQKLLLPREVPRVPGFELGMFYQSAGQVGGDYLDLIKTGEHELGMAVADVAGKGVPAALLMVHVRSNLRTLAVDHASPRRVLTELNRALSGDTTPGRFVTVLYCVLNTESRELVLSSAGHCPLLLYSGESEGVLQYKPIGLPLGMDKGPLFEKNLEEQKLTLKPGQIVLLYSDGITEAMNAEHQQFGEQRLCSALQALRDKPAQDIALGIKQKVDVFVAGHPQSDDFSVIVLKVL